MDIRYYYSIKKRQCVKFYMFSTKSFLTMIKSDQNLVYEIFIFDIYFGKRNSSQFLGLRSLKKVSRGKLKIATNEKCLGMAVNWSSLASQEMIEHSWIEKDCGLC